MIILIIPSIRSIRPQIRPIRPLITQIRPQIRPPVKLQIRSYIRPIGTTN